MVSPNFQTVPHFEPYDLGVDPLKYRPLIDLKKKGIPPINRYLK